MPNTIPYKSFCWSLGTTSFRGSSQKAVEPRAASERPGSVALRSVGLDEEDERAC